MFCPWLFPGAPDLSLVEKASVELPMTRLAGRGQEAHPHFRSGSCPQKNLSQIILASACNGKRDVEQLKEIALRGVAGGPHRPE